MGTTKTFWRLRIRDVTNTTNAVIWSSVPTDTNPHIVGEPEGDGQELDPLKGSVTVGAYRLLVADVLTAPNTRSVTSQLADADARMTLLSRWAFIERSPDGSTWNPYVAGYVNEIRLVDEMNYEFTIGDTRRVEMNTDVFKTATPAFNGLPCVIGGPVLEGWGTIEDYGPVRFVVTDVQPDYVKIVWVRGPAPPTYTIFDNSFIVFNPAFGGPSRSFPSGQLPRETLAFINNWVATYFEWDATYIADNIYGDYPTVFAALYNPADGTFVNQVSCLAIPGSPPEWVYKLNTPAQYSTQYYVGQAPVCSSRGEIYLQWPTGATLPQPALGTEYNLYLFPSVIDEDHPCHFLLHPVDLATLLWDENGIPFDAAAAAAVRTAMGPAYRLAGRITQSSKLSDFLEQYVYGPFGLGARVNAVGEMQLFQTRAKPTTAPVATIGLAQLRDAEAVVFDLDESTICNLVVLTTQRYMQWTKATGGSKPFDDTRVVEQIFSISNGDASTVGNMEQDYTLEAAILLISDYLGSNGMYPWQGVQDPALPDFAAAIAAYIFDLFGRGGVYYEIDCTPDVTADVGDFVVLDLPQIPGAYIGQSPIAQRGTPRLGMVCRRTETTPGPELKVIDAGYAAAPSLVPTFTLLPSTTDPRFYAVAAVTNGPALAAIPGCMVRAEIDFALSPPGGGAVLAFFNPATRTVINLPRADAGLPIAVRMRSEVPGNLPGAWSAWETITLTPLNPVTAPVVLFPLSTGDEATIKFTPGESDIGVQVRLVQGPSNPTPAPPVVTTGQPAVVVVPGQMQLTIPGGAPEVVVQPPTMTLQLTGGGSGGVSPNPSNPNGRIGFSISSGDNGKPGQATAWRLMTPGGLMVPQLATQERYLITGASSPTNLTMGFADLDALVNQALAAGVAIEFYAFTGNNASPSPCYNVVIGAGQTAAEDFISTYFEMMKAHYGDIFDGIVGVNESLITSYTTNPLYNEWSGPQTYSTGYLQYILTAIQTYFPSARRLLNFGHELESGQQSAVVALATGLVGAHPGLLTGIEWECHEDARQVQSGALAAAIAAMTTTNASINALGLTMDVSEFDVLDLTGIGAGDAGIPARDELNRQAVQILGSWFIAQPNARNFKFWNPSDNLSWENPEENASVPADFVRSDKLPPRPDLLDAQANPKTPYTQAQIYFPQLESLAGAPTPPAPSPTPGGSGIRPGGMTTVFDTGDITSGVVNQGNCRFIGGAVASTWDFVAGNGSILLAADAPVDPQPNGFCIVMPAGQQNDAAYDMFVTFPTQGTGWFYLSYWMYLGAGWSLTALNANWLKAFAPKDNNGNDTIVMGQFTGWPGWTAGQYTNGIGEQGPLTYNFPNVSSVAPPSNAVFGVSQWVWFEQLFQPDSSPGAGDAVLTLAMNGVQTQQKTGTSIVGVGQTGGIRTLHLYLARAQYGGGTKQTTDTRIYFNKLTGAVM